MRGRRLLLLCFCWIFLAATPPIYSRGLLDRILHPFAQSHRRSSGSHTSHSPVVWSGLVVAENVEKPQPIPSELSSFEKTLKDLFGYNQFQVIGESRKTLKTGDEDWLAASKHFSLHVDTRG